MRFCKMLTVFITTMLTNNMLKTILILNFLNILAIQCGPVQPVTACTTTEVTAIKGKYLNDVATTLITDEDQISSNEHSEELLSQYQSRVIDLQNNLIYTISEEKNHASDAAIACLTTLEGFILLSHQKIDSKFTSKHIKIQEKIKSTRAKFDTKLFQSKLKASKSIEKCTTSGSSCSAIENCCIIAVNKLDVLKYEVTEVIQKLELKHTQSLEEIYQDAANFAVHMSNQIVICSPPRPSTTESLVVIRTTEQTETIDPEIESKPDVSSEEGSTSLEESKESNENNNSNESHVPENTAQPDEDGEDSQTAVDGQDPTEDINVGTNKMDTVTELEELKDVDNRSEEIAHNENANESTSAVNAEPHIPNAEEQHDGDCESRQNCEYVPQQQETRSAN